MLVECSNCGAPLDVGTGARVVRCAYCGRPSRARAMKTIAQQAPGDWKPPQTWTPPEQAPAPSRPMPYHGTKTYGSGCVVFLPILLVVLLGALPALIATGTLSKVTAAIGIGGWDGEEPLRCGGNDSVTIDGVTADLGKRTAITVTANCELTIKNSTIKAWEGIRADGNRRVVIESCRIDAEGAAVSLGGNKEALVIDSTLVSRETAIPMSGNAEIRVVGGRIEAGKSAFSLGGNAERQLRGTVILENRAGVQD